MKKQTKRKIIKRPSYTLLELIVVVAIVAIISVVAAPVYQNYVEHSKVAEINTQIANYLQQWAENYNSNPNFADITATAVGKYISTVVLDKTSGVTITLNNPSKIMTDFDGVIIAYKPYQVDNTGAQVNAPFTTTNAIDNKTIYFACTYTKAFNGVGGDSPNIDQWLSQANSNTPCAAADSATGVPGSAIGTWNSKFYSSFTRDNQSGTVSTSPLACSDGSQACTNVNLALVAFGSYLTTIADDFAACMAGPNGPELCRAELMLCGIASGNCYAGSSGGVFNSTLSTNTPDPSQGMNIAVSTGNNDWYSNPSNNGCAYLPVSLAINNFGSTGSTGTTSLTCWIIMSPTGPQTYCWSGGNQYTGNDPGYITNVDTRGDGGESGYVWDQVNYFSTSAGCGGAW